MIEFVTFFTLGIVMAWTVGKIIQFTNDSKAHNEQLKQAIIDSMVFLDVETVESEQDTVYLAYDAKNRKFLAQAQNEANLVKMVFDRFPKYEMLWLQQQGQWVPRMRPDIDIKSPEVV